jgi:hypothetical protein
VKNILWNSQHLPAACYLVSGSWPPTQIRLCTGRLVRQRHTHLPHPSHHAIRSTCMQLLPLIEMYCKWELEEDCTNLHALMLRFDSESELQSHDLGRSLLSMVREEDAGLDILPLRATLPPQPSPFDLVRDRLAAAALAIRTLRTQVHPVLVATDDSDSAIHEVFYFCGHSRCFKGPCVHM